MAALAVAGVGDASLIVAGFAGLFPHAMLGTLPGCGHFPWLEQPNQMQSRLLGVCAWRHGRAFARGAACACLGTPHHQVVLARLVVRVALRCQSPASLI